QKRKKKLRREINTMNRDQHLRIVEPLLRCPTAPTFEGAVAEEICRQLRGPAGIHIEKDQFGNLIVVRSGAAEARYACFAHMDYPGWRLRSKKEFLGGV